MLRDDVLMDRVQDLTHPLVSESYFAGPWSMYALYCEGATFEGKTQMLDLIIDFWQLKFEVDSMVALCPSAQV